MNPTREGTAPAPMRSEERRKMAPAMRATATSIVLATLVACGGGGGGGGDPRGSGGPTAIEVPFTSFAVIVPNQTVVMDSTAVTASGDQVTIGGNTTITSATLNPVAAATVRLSADGARALKSISINTPLSPQTSVSFDRDTPGHSVSCSFATCLAESATASAIVMDPFVLGWNYQSFGVWGNDLSPTSWVLGAASAGHPTTGNAVPTMGGAVFTGLAAGFYFDSFGTPFATAAAMSADVNFSARSIAFSTSNTTLVNTNNPNAQPTTDQGLNLTGTLSYMQGVNSFSGNLQTQNMQLSGQGSGRFYGPAAEEIGGVYSLSTTTSVSRMVGGFGGKRP